MYHTLALTGSPEEYQFLFAFSYETMQMFPPLKLITLTVMQLDAGIAQATMEDQAILILDETINGLDKEDIELLCDEVYEMNHGVLAKLKRD